MKTRSAARRGAFVAMRAGEARCSKVGLRVEAEHHGATPAGLRLQRQQQRCTMLRRQESV